MSYLYAAIYMIILAVVAATTVVFCRWEREPRNYRDET